MSSQHDPHEQFSFELGRWLFLASLVILVGVAFWQIFW